MKRKCLGWRQKCILCIIPFLIGIIIFSFNPFLKVIYYSFIKSQFVPEFVGFKNYVSTMNNQYFRLALKNSCLLVIHAVIPLVIMASVIAVYFTEIYIQNPRMKIIYMLPMAVPTAVISVIWRMVFKWNDNCMALDILFIWKNLGLCTIFIMSALASIPKSVYEAAQLDGANRKQIISKIMFPMASPVIVFVFLFEIVNSFKIFRESYLYYGSDYPPEYAYTLQYYMNNSFSKLNYQNLATSAIFTTILCTAIVLILSKLIRRFEY